MAFVVTYVHTNSVQPDPNADDLVNAVKHSHNINDCCESLAVIINLPKLYVSELSTSVESFLKPDAWPIKHGPLHWGRFFKAADRTI